MTIVWFRGKGKAYLGCYEFDITCSVRNELNGRRKLHDPKEVVRAVVKGQYGPPYMPRQFPLGRWEIKSVEDTTNADFAPFKIRTTAKQEVETWELDDKGGYDRPSGKFVVDEGYHLHWAQFSKTTLGCGRVGLDTSEQVESLTSLIREAIMLGGRIWLEVVE